MLYMNNEDIKLQKNLKQIDFGYVCKQKCLYNMAQLIQCNFLINFELFWRQVYSWLPSGNVIQYLEHLIVCFCDFLHHMSQTYLNVKYVGLNYQRMTQFQFRYNKI